MGGCSSLAVSEGSTPSVAKCTCSRWGHYAILVRPTFCVIAVWVDARVVISEGSTPSVAKYTYDNK
jgi:hypothetical protein